MQYCSKCGKELMEGSQFCPGCGQAVGGQQTQQPVYPQPRQSYPQPVYQNTFGILQQLSSKIKTNAVIWIIIAVFQFIVGLFNMVVGFALNADYEDGTTNIIMGIFVILVGVMNMINASRDLKYSKDVLVRPLGIVKRFQPVGNLIGTLIYNLFFGGIIGIVGSIYAFILRNFVMTNAAQFEVIEANCTQNTVPQMHN